MTIIMFILATESCLRLVDVDEDGRLDVIVGLIEDLSDDVMLMKLGEDEEYCKRKGWKNILI